MATTPTTKKKRKQQPPPAPESENTVQVTVAAVVEEENMGKKKKISDEIDDIFQGKKAKKSKTSVTGDNEAQDRAKKLATGTAGSENLPPGKKSGGKKKRNGKVDSGERTKAKGPRRRTADGLAIYSAAELGWGGAEAGGTPLCPFDCSCCF